MQTGEEDGRMTHWTHKLFVENAELYLPSLEQALDRADAEATAIARLLGESDVDAGARVLDVACGIGRHAIPLAERGYKVTGVDISPLFVQRARERATAAEVDVRFVVGDMQEAETLLGVEAPFHAFVNMFTSNGYYGQAGDLSLFSQLRRLASPRAVLVVLTANRDWLVRNFEPEGLDKAGTIRILQRRALDLETSTMHNDWEFYEGADESLTLRLNLQMEHRLYSLHEFKDLLEAAGWNYLRGFGSDRGPDFQIGELTYDSMAMWVVAGLAETPQRGVST